MALPLHLQGMNNATALTPYTTRVTRGLVRTAYPSSGGLLTCMYILWHAASRQGLATAKSAGHQHYLSCCLALCALHKVLIGITAPLNAFHVQPCLVVWQLVGLMTTGFHQH